MPPLRKRGRHGTAHARVMPGVGGTAPCPTTRYRREFGPRGDRRSHAEGATRVHRCPLLMLASHVRKGARRERKGEKLSSIEGAVTPDQTGPSLGLARRPRQRGVRRSGSS